MVAHAILFIVLPLAVAWLAGASAYFPPYSRPEDRTRIEPKLRQRSGCSWPSTANLTLPPAGAWCRA